MDALPFNATDLSAADIEHFQSTHRELKAKFPVQHTGYINFHLEDFEAFNAYHSFNVRDSYVIKNGYSDCYLLFADTHLKKVISKSKVTDVYEHQTWALAYLKHDLGRVKIRPETLVDKIAELIHPIELDFKEDKAFSDTFYVLVDDHEKAVKGIDRTFRNAVMDIREDDFVIEIVNHTLIIGNKKPVSPKKAVYMAEFVCRLAALNC
ncbi:hypothetical protein [Mucilaginibacter segetis]|uniref:Uncharacterized protein n=1 Tax=Mucilaginibacter segetis TaxID=2793071 RepID=A0A934UPH5_9SPHI|nr:hypothetical protein [Mucilaginibacter segetis]MBK0380901.1 hypothetical protein [Mucilaginibacter segetis]